MPALIIEHEILEQIADEDWPLHRVVAFVQECKDPWQVLLSLYQDNCIQFFDKDKKTLSKWKIAEIFRNKIQHLVPEVFVAITSKGLDRAH